MRDDLMSYSPFSKKEHKIDPVPAVSSDHPYSKLSEKDTSNKEHGHLSNGASYVKTTFKKEHECRGECSKVFAIVMSCPRL